MDLLRFFLGVRQHKKFLHVQGTVFCRALACYVFTKLLRLLVKRWRSKGIRAIVYMDDGIGALKTKALNEAHRDVISNLEQAGFVLNILLKTTTD